MRSPHPSHPSTQIIKGIDYNTTDMLQPFVDAGVVIRVPYDQDSSEDHLDNGKKNGNSRECLEAYGKDADWVSIMDTDEAFYIYEQGKGALGSLNRLLR